MFQIINIWIFIYLYFSKFTNYAIEVSWIEISGFFILLFLCLVSFFIIKMFFESFSKESLFATKEEIEALMPEVRETMWEKVKMVSFSDGKKDIIENMQKEIDSLEDEKLKKDMLKKFAKMQKEEKEYRFNMAMIEIYWIIDEFYQDNDEKKWKKSTKIK